MLEPVTTLPLFAYGSLRDATFVGQLLERPVRAENAVLLDYRLLELPGLPYPVVGEAAGEEVEGRFYRDVGRDEYVRLDAYEGVAERLYRRVVARVRVAGSARPEGAYVYVPTGQTLRRYG